MILKPSQIEDCERNQTIKNKSKNNTKNTLLNNFTLFNKSPPQIQNKRIQLVKIKNRQIRLQQKLIKRDLLRIKSLLLCNLKLKSKVTFHADLTLTEYLKWLYNQENLINVKEWFRDTIEIYSVYWKYVISFTLILSLFYCVLWFSIFNIYQVIVLKNNSKSPFPNDENQCVLNTKLFSYQKLILFDNSLEAKLSILLLPQAKSYLKSILANLKADKLSNYLSHLLLNPNQIQSNIKDQNRFNNKASHDLIYNNNNNNVINNNNNININNNMNTINSTNNKNVLYQKKKSEFLNQMDNCSFKSVHLILVFFNSFFEAYLTMHLFHLTILVSKNYFKQKQQTITFKNIIPYFSLKRAFWFIFIDTFFKKFMISFAFFSFSMINCLFGFCLNFMSFWFLIVQIDKKIPVWITIKISLQMIHKHFFGTLIFFMFLIIFNFSFYLLSIFGLLFSIPFSYVLLTAAYLHVFGSTKKIHIDNCSSSSTTKPTPTRPLLSLSLSPLEEN